MTLEKVSKKPKFLPKTGATRFYIYVAIDTLLCVVILDQSHAGRAVALANWKVVEPGLLQPWCP